MFEIAIEIEQKLSWRLIKTLSITRSVLGTIVLPIESERGLLSISFSDELQKVLSQDLDFAWATATLTHIYRS